MVCLQNRPVCGAMFRQSCFGDYVSMPIGFECHHLLCHYIMCKEVTTFDPVDLEELLFSVGDYWVCFDMKAFSLLTGLRFGDYFHPSSGFATFRERVFPFVPISCSVSVPDLTYVFNNLLYQLSNEDVVRVSLLYMPDQQFLGKYPRKSVTNERMTLVSNLYEYPCGRLIWDFTYKQMRVVFDKIEGHLNPNMLRIDSRHTYTL
uniref:Uncharacterized protein n=1 Tax=Lactuca sativa TaxID=4236 RepID=A0A9R1UVD5_LACSA|nr:hypothetical protein LSAT_V11C800417230 [Lactuca sativa]